MQYAGRSKVFLYTRPDSRGQIRYDRYLCGMPQHEPKSCPRCNTYFECKVGNVAECQCNGIAFTEDEKHYIAQQYSDCLCRKCLLEMKHEIRLKDFNARVKRILN